jgi:hypothetical protein
VNTFLNENWKELEKATAPAFAEVIARTITTIINNIAALVPYEEVFPESAQ